MAIIQASGHLKGESAAEAKAGLCVSASAHCFGRASGGIGRPPPPPEEDEEPTTEPKPPQGN